MELTLNYLPQYPHLHNIYRVLHHDPVHLPLSLIVTALAPLHRCLSQEFSVSSRISKPVVLLESTTIITLFRKPSETKDGN